MENQNQEPSSASHESPCPAQAQGITAREFFTYLAGSYLIAAVLNIGFGLAVDAKWKTVVGMTMVLGLIIFGVTLADQQKRQD